MVDACFKAISEIAGRSPQLQRYAVKAITGGTDAQGEVSCLVSEEGSTVTGQGSHTDIIQASALAYIRRAEQARVPATVQDEACRRRSAMSTMTMTEKILARAPARPRSSPGTTSG
jgi:hypothetical protein